MRKDWMLSIGSWGPQMFQSIPILIFTEDDDDDEDVG